MESYLLPLPCISSSDWEDTICMPIFFAGCNFRCPFCFNGPLLDFREEYLQPLRQVQKLLQKQAPFCDGVLFCGAEPTLQRQALVSLARSAKELGLQVAVETNGTRPEVLAGLLEEGLLDRVILGLNAPLEKELFGKIVQTNTFFKPLEDTMEHIRQTIALLSLHTESIEAVIRTTIVPNLLFRREHIHAIGGLIQHIPCTWELRPFVPQSTLVSKRLGERRPPSVEFLKDLKDSCQALYPNLKIQVQTSKAYDHGL